MRALVHGGGGSNGDWGVGVLRWLLINERRQYDIYVGISTGALSLAYLTQFRHDQADEAILGLQDIYLRKVKDSSSIYKKWLPGPLNYAALLFKNSVYNTAPLAKIVHEGLDSKKLLISDKKLIVGAVRLGGDRGYQTFDNLHPDIVEAVLASSAFPVMFKPVEIRNRWYSDGGIRNVVPLKDAILAGATDIDVIVTSPEKMPPSKFDVEKASVLDMAGEVTGTMVDEVLANDLIIRDVKMCELKNRLPEYRQINVRVFRPSRDLGDSLSFGKDKFPSHSTNIQLGLLDAQRTARGVL